MRRTLPLLLLTSSLVALFVLALPLATAQRDPDTVLTADDNGEEIEIRVGDMLQIELPDDPESGSLWLLLPTETFAGADVVIGDVWAVGPAATAGFQTGDQFLSVNEQPVKSSLDLDAALVELEGETVPVTVLRGEEEITIDLTLEAYDMPNFERPMVTGFMEDMPAEAAGFEVGDVMLAINGEDITNITALQQAIGLNEDVEVVVKVQRGVEKLEIPVTPQVDPEGFVRIGVAITALDYHISGLGIANLNVESYIGVRPFNSPIPLPQGVERRYALAQAGDPERVPAPEDDADGQALTIWRFEAISMGATRLTLLYIHEDQQPEDIDPSQFYEVFVEVRPARGPAA